MSPDRLQSSDADSIVELPTMVLSSVPTESSHVTMQDQRNRSSPNQQPRQQQQLQQQKKKQSEIIISNSLSHNLNKNQHITQSTATSISSVTKSTVSSQSLPVSSIPSAIITSTTNLTPSTIIMPSSKLLVLQQSNLNDGSSSTTTYSINGTDSTNIGGKYVLVATEQMDIDHHNGNIRAITTTNPNNDEELTSLTWLHEKNVLKGNIYF